MILKCWVFGGKTGPCPMVRVFLVVRPVTTVKFRAEPYPEPTRELRPVGNTTNIAISLSLNSHLLIHMKGVSSFFA